MNKVTKERPKVDRKRKADRASKAIVTRRVLAGWRKEWGNDGRVR